MKLDLILHFYNITGIITYKDFKFLQNNENTYTYDNYKCMLDGLDLIKFFHHTVLAFDEISVIDETLKKWSEVHNVRSNFGDILENLKDLVNHLYSKMADVQNISLYLAGAGSSMIFMGHSRIFSPLEIHHLDLELFSVNDVNLIARNKKMASLPEGDAQYILDTTGGIPRYVEFFLDEFEDGHDLEFSKKYITFSTKYNQYMIPSLKFLLTYQKIPKKKIPLKIYSDMLRQELPLKYINNILDNNKLLSVLGIPYELDKKALLIKLPSPLEDILENERSCNALLLKYLCTSSEFMEQLSRLTLFELRYKKINWSFLSEESPLFEAELTNIIRLDLKTQLKKRNIKKIGDILLQDSIKNEDNILVKPADRSSTPDSFLILKRYNSIICIQDKNYTSDKSLSMNMICSELTKMIQITKEINSTFHILGIITVTNTIANYENWFFNNSEKIDFKKYVRENPEETSQLSDFEEFFDQIELYVLVGKKSLSNFYNNDQFIEELYE